MSATALRVPPEFKGLARAFVDRLQISAIQAERAQASTWRYASALMKRRPGKWHRPEHLDEVTRRWLTQPEAGSLMPPEVIRGPHSLTLRALRMLPATSTRVEWDGKELAIMISQSGMDIDRKGMTANSGPLASISHHCLARRMQRGFGPTDDEAITADVRDLVAYFARTRINDDHADLPFNVPCPTGEWLGYVRKVTSAGRGFVVLAARTFT